jgi:DNA polymerase-3 subunit gamma/tau
MRAFNAAAIDTRGGWAPSLGLELAFAEVLEAPVPAPAVGPVSKPGGASTPPGKPPVSPTPGSHPVPNRTPSASSATHPAPGSAPDKPAETRPAAAGSTSLDALSKAWHQISAIVKKKDSNVAALLNSGKLIEIKDGVLILGFASDILQSKFNRPECLEMAQAAIREALDVELAVQAVLASGKGTLPPNVKPDGMVATANQLGGEIVDIQ